MKKLSEIEQVINDIIDSEDIYFGPAEDGVGLLATAGELVSVKDKEDGKIFRLLIQPMSTTYIGLNPKDYTLGFTRDDIEVIEGVVVADVLDDITFDMTKPASFEGEVFPIEEFLRTYVTDQKTANRLRKFMKKLNEVVIPTDKWFEKVNDAYAERIPGRRWITGARVSIC